ncbi:hypothetical protein ACHHYP_16868 [Achlya hypogyna]|uniref:Uncharacterized protein n=1 Tax=Achlya hypogyna TaxID=1202772 RepID=A0A1V9Y5J9_ACHHY|nr:hypothetical protein ACHHYP_16868 [Achlya hypogyna]
MTKKARKNAAPKSRIVSMSKATRKHVAIDRLHIPDYHHKCGGSQTRTVRHFRANCFSTLYQATISRLICDFVSYVDEDNEVA